VFVKDYFVLRNVDRFGIAMGVGIAALWWVVAGVLPHEKPQGKDLAAVVLISAVVGVSASRWVGYQLPMPDAGQGRVARRLLAIYMGLWFGCFQAVTMGAGGGMASFAVHGVMQTVVFGGVMYFSMADPRVRAKAPVLAFDPDRPRDLWPGRGWFLKLYPAVVVAVTGGVGLASRDPFWTGLVWAITLTGIPPLFAPKRTGVWGWLRLLFVGGCAGAAAWLLVTR
jgi:hypothetical protein